MTKCKQRKWRDCHRCEHDGKHSEACLTCPGPAPTMPHPDSGNFVRLDRMAYGTDAAVCAINLNTPGVGVDDDETVNAKQVRTILEEVAKLDKRRLLLFHGLLKGMGMTEAAEYADLSRQLSYAFAHDAVDVCPALAALLPTRITSKTGD